MMGLTSTAPSRAPGMREPAIAHPDRHGGARRLHRIAAYMVAALPDGFRIGEEFAHDLSGSGFRHLLPGLFVLIDQAKVLHGGLRVGAIRKSVSGRGYGRDRRCWIHATQ